MTVTTLRDACTAFRGGVLRTTISGPKQLLVALEGLSRDGRLDEEERKVFGRAKGEVGRLWAVQREGVRKTDMDETEATYAAYWEWWRPVLGVLHRDREKREGGKKREDGMNRYSAAIASGLWPLREGRASVNEGSVSEDGRSVGGSVGSKRPSGTGSLGALFGRKFKDVFKKEPGGE